MPTAILWQTVPNSRGNVLSTELNALASGSRTNAGTAIDNSTNLDKYGYLELNVDFVSAPSAGAYCAIYMVMSLDGTNYADGSSTVDPGADAWVINIPILASTAAQNKQVGPIALPPSKFKLILLNVTGQAFPASGSTLELFTANDEVQ
jgi:hypothetical protein